MAAWLWMHGCMNARLLQSKTACQGCMNTMLHHLHEDSAAGIKGSMHECKAARIQGSMMQGCKNTRQHECKAARIQGSMNARLQEYKAASMQAAGIQVSMTAKLFGCHAAWIQGCIGAWLHCNAYMHGCSHSYAAWMDLSLLLVFRCIQ